MKIKPFKLAAIAVGSGAVVGVAVLAYKIRKHGGHISIGVGKSETRMVWDGKMNDIVDFVEEQVDLDNDISQ